MAALVSKPIPVPTRETKPYWEGCKAHELKIQRCAECGHYQFYPRIYCTKCMSDRVAWIQASGRAKVLSLRSYIGQCQRPSKKRFPTSSHW